MNKYRVLSADDEYWSRENIRNLIPWEEYSIEFLEPACDGEEVLERVEEEKPDIIITDINMPFLSGLELLDRLRSNYPDIITIAISGYDDFEKVKGVFMSGGIDYLLKPVSKEELIKVITKALGILEERVTARAHDENLIMQEHKLSSFMEDSEYSAILSAKLYGHNEDQVHMPSGKTFSEVEMVMVKFYDISEIANGYDHDILQMSYNIKQKLKELYGSDSHMIIFNNRNKMSEFLIAGEGGPDTLQAFSEKVMEAFPIEEFGPLSIVLHEQTSSLNDIATVYREMIAQLVGRPFSRIHFLLKCPENKDPVVAQSFRASVSNIENDLTRLIKNGQRTEAARLIFQTEDFEHCDSSGWTYLDVRQYVNQVNGILTRYVRKYCPELNSMLEDAIDNMDYHIKCLDTASMLKTMNIILDTLWNKEEPQQLGDSVSDQIDQIYNYIQNQYFENITLASLAEQYHIDACYLSRMFRKKYSETVVSYITRIRIENAIALMSDAQKKMETISFLVGYDDYNYFSRVFRKKMGKSPSEYRKQLN